MEQLCEMVPDLQPDQASNYLAAWGKLDDTQRVMSRRLTTGSVIRERLRRRDWERRTLNLMKTCCTD